MEGELSLMPPRLMAATVASCPPREVEPRPWSPLGLDVQFLEVFMGASLEAAYAQDVSCNELPILPSGGMGGATSSHTEQAGPASPSSSSGAESPAEVTQADVGQQARAAASRKARSPSRPDASTPPRRIKSPVKRFRVTQLTAERVREVQHMSLQDAARACGMCSTQFKLQCRKLRISKWPSRQLRSIQHLIEETTTASGRLDLSARNRTELEGWVGELKTLQTSMEATPHQELPLYLKTYGCWMKKQSWRARHNKNGGANLKVPKLPSRSA